MTTTSTPADPTPEDIPMTTTAPTFDLPLDVDLDAPDTNEPVQLAADDLACRECGRVVAGPVDISAVSWDDPTSIERPDGLGTSTAVHGLAAEPLTVCTTCADRRRVAHDLAEQLLPRGVSLHGMHYTGEHVGELVAAALAVLAALDAPVPTTMNRDVLGIIVRRLAPLGTSLSWGARFAPVRSADARPGDRESPAVGAYPRVQAAGPAQRLRGRPAGSDHAPAAPGRSAAPSPQGPGVHVPDGCLFCGVRAVTVSATTVAAANGVKNAARDVWSPRIGVSPLGLGGRFVPGGISGQTCPTCSEAVRKDGASGPSAAEKALADHLGAPWSPSEFTVLTGLRIYGALVSEAHRTNAPVPEPNATPWAHLSGLDELRVSLGGAP